MAPRNAGRAPPRPAPRSFKLLNRLKARCCARPEISPRDSDTPSLQSEAVLLTPSGSNLAAHRVAEPAGA